MIIPRLIALCLCLVMATGNTPFAKASEITPAVVYNHMQVIGQLKERFASSSKKYCVFKPSTTECGPTQAHLSLPKIKDAVDRAYGHAHALERPEVAQIVKKVQDREQEFKDDYYVFYHGQFFEFRVLQDIVKTVLQLLHLQGKNKHFVYLRMPTEFYTPLTPKTVAEEFKSGADDHSQDLQKRLISVNLSLFGNINLQFIECTFNFFILSYNCHRLSIKDEIHTFFSLQGLPVEFVNQVIELCEKFKTREGNLIQIFIPKNKVDTCAYLCKPLGHPYDQPIVPAHFDSAKQMHTKFGPVLEEYCNNPARVENLDALQARLIIANDTLLNPNSGIKIYRYGTMSKAHKRAYKTELKAIVEKLIVNCIENKMGGQSRPFEKLVRFIEKSTAHSSAAKSAPVVDQKISSP